MNKQRLARDWRDIKGYFGPAGERMDLSGIATYVNLAEMFADPQVRHNGIVAAQNHPIAGPIRVVGIPVKLSDTPGEIGAAASQVGEHSRDILQELGYEAAQIDRMQHDEVIDILGG